MGVFLGLPSATWHIEEDLHHTGPSKKVVQCVVELVVNLNLLKV